MDVQTEYMTVTEAATLAGVHRNTIRNAISSGKLPAVKFGDTGKWRINKKDLAAYMGVTEL